MGKGKPRGLNSARKLRTKRRDKYVVKEIEGGISEFNACVGILKDTLWPVEPSEYSQNVAALETWMIDSCLARHSEHSKLDTNKQPMGRPVVQEASAWNCF
jgi:hypothetical protein